MAGWIWLPDHNLETREKGASSKRDWEGLQTLFCKTLLLSTVFASLGDLQFCSFWIAYDRTVIFVYPIKIELMLWWSSFLFKLYACLFHLLISILMGASLYRDYYNRESNWFSVLHLHIKG